MLPRTLTGLLLAPALAPALALALAACGSRSTVVEGDITTGTPVVGVPVTLLDQEGHRAVSAPSDARGHFRMEVRGLRPPFVLSAPYTNLDGAPGTLYTLQVSRPQSGNTYLLMLHPLTTLLAQRVLNTSLQTLPTEAQLQALKPESLKTAAQSLDVLLRPMLDALHVSPAQAPSFITGSMAPDDNIARVLAMMRIDTHRARIAIGSGAARATLAVPPTGELPAPVAASAVASALQLAQGPTRTPIRHVIIVVGENQTFDSLYGTYQPPAGEQALNLLSQGIVQADGKPGANYARVVQRRAQPQAQYMLNPPRAEAYEQLPQPRLRGVYTPAMKEAGIGADTRFPARLPPGPFPITAYVPYPRPEGGTALAAGAGRLAGATGDPVHRFFQMWQQTGGDNAHPDLHAWVALTAGAGGDTAGITAEDPRQGGELMGYLDMARGDAPYLRQLAERYALADNMHQSIMGGTGANFFALATADVAWFNVDGKPAAPPEAHRENPDPQKGTANFYTRDGYQGGSYVNCADASQPGVGAILSLLQQRKVASNCETDHWYLVNNFGAGYDVEGHPQPIGPDNYNYPPQDVPTIAEALAAKGIAWKWYTGAREPADVAVEMQAQKLDFPTARRFQYNDTGDPLVASRRVMTDPSLRAGLAGLSSFYADIEHGRLPAVSFVIPKNLDSGHPGYSVAANYEAFVREVVDAVQARPELWADTAIIITTDEGGGYFDSGPIQPLDFFGDGPRIPLLVVSPYARQGWVDHVYRDHASILKFIERNWGLPPLSPRSRDTLPDAVASEAAPYLPINGPAVGSLDSLFDF